MGNQSESWSEQLVERLKELYLCGDSASVLGRKLGKTRGAVIAKMRRLGLKSLYIPPPPKERARQPKAAQVAQMSRRPVPFLRTGPHHCRAVLDRRGKGDCVLVCGDPQIAESSYCQPHHDLYTQEPQPRKEVAQWPSRQR